MIHLTRMCSGMLKHTGNSHWIAENELLHIFCKIDKPIKFLQRGNSFATSVHPNVSMYNNKMMYRMCFILWDCRKFKLMIQIQWYYRRTVFDFILLCILIFIHIHTYIYNMQLHRILKVLYSFHKWQYPMLDMTILHHTT